MSKTAKNTILAIETSCDETAAAILRGSSYQNAEVLSEMVASQVDVHTETGGVVPNVAAREHARVISPLITQVLQKAGVRGSELDAIAVTVGPGLMPALSVGVQAARTLAFAWDIPIIPVHHIEGHVYSAITEVKEAQIFPALALIVSGGHTMLIRINNDLQYQILGQTRDDAAGEVFDKVARMLELPYPGGPKISELAETGDDTAYEFPQPMLKSGDFDFSFSGLKTAVLYTLRDLKEAGQEIKTPDIAASFERAVVSTLTQKTKQALQADSYASLLLAGGVAANARLREELANIAQEESIVLGVAPIELCGDNAVMIGQVGLTAHAAGREKQWSQIAPTARISIEKFSIN